MSGQGGQKVTSFWARSWGCTGRTDSLGNASSWSPASASPRWSWLHPDSLPARWGHTCEKLPSGCDKQRIIRHADSFHSSKKVQAASVAMDWFTRQYLDTQMATLDATKSDVAFNYHGNCIKKWTNITGDLTSRMVVRVSSAKLCLGCLQTQGQKSSPGFDYGSKFIHYLEEQLGVWAPFLCSPTEMMASGLCPCSI